MSTINFQLNGQTVSVDAHPMASLLETLRRDAAHPGTKYGCGEGECGACSVLLNGELVMSCMVPTCQAEGARIETIEGLESTPEAIEGLHPIQKSFIECGGAQCGICTPGMIMAAVSYCREPWRAPGGLKEALSGNLCRCTGYTKIYESVEKVINAQGRT